MKNFYFGFTISLLMLLNLLGYSQIEQGGLPLSIQNPQLIKSAVVYETMPAIDIERLMAEDAINDKYSDIPWRFGENIEVNFNLNNSGSWEYFAKGDKVWRLGIKCPGAYTINLTFDNYRLPPGAKLFVYNADQTHIIGAFTDFNNQEDHLFATTLLKGDQIVIEYYEPPYAEFPGELSLFRVTHGYRDAFDYAKAFGQSGSCNVNVACPQSAGMENQIRSVCMLVSGGNGFCSGALINNTAQDGKPYVLSADHCYSSPGSVVYWFNWQSPTCSNPSSSPPYNSMSGATQRARNSTSDFWLVELNQSIPSGYNVYYSGWNRTTDNYITGKIWGIHHPSGDIKKISWSLLGVSTTTYLQNTVPGNGSHWRITNWSDGTTTEGGSSGSPLFDPNGRIIGQLHGGYASCSSITSDWYGKFGVSWTGGGTSATRLSNWLDPTNSGVTTLDGYDPNAATSPPVANFSASTTTPYIGQTVTFTDLSTNTPTSWSWSFSPSTVTYVGGTTSTSQHPQVQFNAAGYYTVTLTATNAAGSDGETKTNYILASVAPPVANFSASTTTPYVGQTVTFTDLSTNTPTSWSWSFSPTTVTYVGGTSSTSQHPQVQFNAAGYYTVTLTATNAGGSDGETKTNYILASVAPPVADFSASTTTPIVGQTVAFTDLSINTPTSWSWSFTPSTVIYVGGTSSSSQNPQVQFNAGGYYTVTLTATNAGGSDGETKTNYINALVNPPVATLKLGSLDNPAPGTVLVPVTLEAISNPVLGNNLISSWAWYVAYDASVLYNAAPSMPANLTNFNAQFPSANYVTNIIENHPSPGWNTIAIIYAAAVSGTGSAGLKFFDIVFTYNQGTTACPNLYWTSTSISETNMADDEGNDFVLTLENGCIWSDPPVADFMASTTTPTTVETVNFTDLSTNYPTSWAWSFSPATVTYIGGTTSTSQNPQVRFDASGYYTITLIATNALGSDTEIKTDYINVQSAIINLDVSVYLEGPFNGSGMTPSLNSLLPLSHPYNLSPWNYGGTESVVSIPNANIVDWVMVELRDASNAASATSATMLDRQAAFLLSNGKVVGLNGSSILQFSNSITQQLFVIIWHRNHIPVMTANNLVENSGIYSYDFSSGATQAFGGSSAHKQIAPGVWGMISGDGNHDGSITLSDKSPIWETQAGTQGYMDSDYNMDSQSDNKDKDDNWAPNLGKGSQVPN